MTSCSNIVGSKHLFMIMIYMIILSKLCINSPIAPNSIIQVGMQFQSSPSQQVVSYYDINQDQHSDILTISTIFVNNNQMQKDLNLYLWNQKLSQFRMETTINLGLQDVRNVICTDFVKTNQLIQLDLILTYDTTLQQHKTYTIQFIKVNCDVNGQACKFDASYNVPELQAIDYIIPSLIVLQGKTSLIYSKNNQANVLNFNSQTLAYQIQILSESQYIQLPVQKSSIGYWLSYFGDYNSDGTADLIISQKMLSSEDISYTTIHFYAYNKEIQKFKHSVSQKLESVEKDLNSNVLFFTFWDINFDGKVDEIILFQSGMIQIHYNKLLTTQLITQNLSILPFDLELTSSNIAKIQRIQLPYKPLKDAVLTFGDINNDGLEDFIVDVEANRLKKSLIMINQLCIEPNNCGVANFNSEFLSSLTLFTLVKFEQYKSLPSSYTNYQSTRMSFIDIYKDGKLDLISHRLSRTQQFISIQKQVINKRQIVVYYNSGYYDSFFMKVSVMEGKNYHKIHQNSLVIGASVNCYVTSVNGEQLPKTANQQPQAGRVMNLPYVFMGLGRSNNYVNFLTITVPYISGQVVSQHSWTPIIPNSQIIIISDPNSSWILTTFIQPTKKMGMVAWLVILALALVGFGICRLSSNQKQEDKQNLESFYSILR